MSTFTFKITLPQVIDTYTVELPYYCKLGLAHWAILAEDHFIEVNYYPTIQSANIFKKDKTPSELERFEVEASTREEFLEIYQKAINLITEKL